MVWLYKDPKGENIFGSAAQGALHLSKLPISSVDTILADQHTNEKEKIDLLAAKVRELESMQVTNALHFDIGNN